MMSAYCVGEKPFRRVFPISMLDYFQTAFEKRARWVFIMSKQTEPSIDQGIMFSTVKYERVPCCVSRVTWDSNTVEVEFRRVYFIKEVEDEETT